MFFNKKHIFPQQIHPDAVIHVSQTCRKVSTKHNELRSSCENVFAIDSLPLKKSAKSPSGGVESSCDNRADIFCQKFIVINFFEGCAHFLRGNTKLLFFFQKRNNLLEKVPLDRKNAFLTIGWRFISKVWQFSAQELKKTQKLSFFQKKEKSLKTFIWAQRGLFDNHPKKLQKN